MPGDIKVLLIDAKYLPNRDASIAPKRFAEAKRVRLVLFLQSGEQRRTEVTFRPVA